MTQLAAEKLHDEERLVASVAGVGPGTDDGVVKRKLGIGFYICVFWLVVVIGSAILAPWLPIKDPDKNYIIPGSRPPYPPSGTFWFGSDQDARDIFSRVIWGARVSLVVGFVAIGFGLLVGGTLGMLAGYFRSHFDRGVSFVFLCLLSFPALILAILMTSLLSRSLTTIALVIGVLAIAPVGRVARANTIAFSDREFVLAARTLGAKNPRIIFRELLPNVLVPMGALALLGIGVAIVAEGGLAFLGLSVQQGTTWGKLILLGSGSRDLQKAPWISMMPILILFLTVLSLNIAGDRLRSYFDVKDTAL
jgi:peptide/nickel transport system permease protein